MSVTSSSTIRKTSAWLFCIMSVFARTEVMKYWLVLFAKQMIGSARENSRSYSQETVSFILAEYIKRFHCSPDKLSHK